MSASPERSAGIVREALQPRRPGAVGIIEKAKNPKHALLRLLPYLAPFRLVLALVLASVVAYTLCGLVGPYLMGVVIDRFIGPGQTDGLMITAIWMLIVYLFYNGFQLVAAWLMSSVSQQALQQMRRDLFTHMQQLSLNFFDHRSTGELMSRLTNDIDAINQAVSENVTTLLAGVLSLVGILVAMFVLDVWLALTSVLVVPMIFGFTRFIAGYTRKGYRDLQQRLGSLNAVAEEAIGGQKVVKAFGRNDSVLAAFNEQNEQVFRAGVYANNYSMLLMPLTGVA